jgi:hypothetical protein
MALLSVGRWDQAATLLTWVQDQRCPDGSYMTGLVYPQRSSFPFEEHSSYSAAAMILAVDALEATGPASGLFLGRSLPAARVLDLDSEAVEADDRG